MKDFVRVVCIRKEGENGNSGGRGVLEMQAKQGVQQQTTSMFLGMPFSWSIAIYSLLFLTVRVVYVLCVHVSSPKRLRAVVRVLS